VTVLALASTLVAVTDGGENGDSSARGQSAEVHRPLEKLDHAAKIRWVYKVAASASGRVGKQVLPFLVLSEHFGEFLLKVWAGLTSVFGRLVKGRCLLRI
jgi:hypothetical protein